MPLHRCESCGWARTVGRGEGLHGIECPVCGGILKTIDPSRPSSHPRGVLGSHLQIEEGQEQERLRLKLTGELDLASTALVRERLEQLRREKRSVLLDLSELDFMGSSGFHLMIDQLHVAEMDGWSLRIDPNIPPRVLRLFRLMRLGRLILEEPSHTG